MQSIIRNVCLCFFTDHVTKTGKGNNYGPNESKKRDRMLTRPSWDKCNERASERQESRIESHVWQSNRNCRLDVEEPASEARMPECRLPTGEENRKNWQTEECLNIAVRNDRVSVNNCEIFWDKRYKCRRPLLVVR